MTATPVCSMLGAIAALNSLTALLNTGGAGSIKIYTGGQPASTTASETGTLLVTLALGNPAFGSAVGGTTNGLATATANTITSGTAGNTGTAGHFRALNGAGTCIFMGNAGTAGTDMILSTTSIVSGGTISITSWVVALPDGTGSD
jgi:hypothetical protein